MTPENYRIAAILTVIGVITIGGVFVIIVSGVLTLVG